MRQARSWMMQKFVGGTEVGSAEAGRQARSWVMQKFVGGTEVGSAEAGRTRRSGAGVDHRRLLGRPLDLAGQLSGLGLGARVGGDVLGLGDQLLPGGAVDEGPDGAQ